MSGQVIGDSRVVSAVSATSTPKSIDALISAAHCDTTSQKMIPTNLKSEAHSPCRSVYVVLTKQPFFFFRRLADFHSICERCLSRFAAASGGKDPWVASCNTYYHDGLYYGIDGCTRHDTRI